MKNKPPKNKRMMKFAGMLVTRKEHDELAAGASKIAKRIEEEVRRSVLMGLIDAGIAHTQPKQED